MYFGAGLLFLLMVLVVFNQSQKQEGTGRSVDAKNQTSNHGTASLPKDPRESASARRHGNRRAAGDNAKGGGVQVKAAASILREWQQGKGCRGGS